MNRTRHLLLGAALLGAAASHAADWSADGAIASTMAPGGLQLSILFLATEGCDSAVLLLDDPNATGIVLEADGKSFAGDLEPIGDTATGLVISTQALRAIKRGTLAFVSTRNGVSAFSLRGSAAALNRAYAICMVATGATSAPLGSWL